MTTRVILIGAGGFGREVISWASDLHALGKFPKITSYIDDNPSALDKFDYNIDYVGAIDAYKPSSTDLFVMGVATPSVKKKVAAIFSKYSSAFLTLIHPAAIVASSASVGRGVVICPFSLVSADASISDFVTLNAMASVGHDSKIGAYSTLSGHVDVTGQVLVGEEVFFGTSAVVLPRISIGNNAKIGAGAVIMRSVRENVVMYAQPAKRL